MTEQPNDPSDEELIRAYLAGDSSAFESLYRRHSGKVYGYVKRRLPNRESADEVFQAVFLKLHTSRANYDRKYPFTQWLFVIAKTALLDHFRKADRQVPLVDDELDSKRVSQIEAPSALGKEEEVETLNSLNADQRQAIEMRVLDELSYEEIAAKLGHSQQSVRQMVSRGIKKLRSLSSPQSGGGS